MLVSYLQYIVQFCFCLPSKRHRSKKNKYYSLRSLNTKAYWHVKNQKILFPFLSLVYTVT